MQTMAGFPAPMPSDVDFYLLNNEDIGFIAALVTGTNDNFTFALPYPASIDLFDETILVHAIEFIGQFESIAVGALQLLDVFLSMLNKDLTATNRGDASDTDDEWFKAQFAGPMTFGQTKISVTAVGAVEGVQRDMDQMQQLIYFPPVPLDLLTPLYVTFINKSKTLALATNVASDADFVVGSTELVQVRVWFTTRQLTSAEKDARDMQLRFQRLDS